MSKLPQEIPVPASVLRSVQNLFLPGEDFRTILNELKYALNPEVDYSIWVKDDTVTVVPKSKINSLDRYFPRLPKEESFKTYLLSEGESFKTFTSKKNEGNPKSDDSSQKNTDDESSDSEKAIFHSTALGTLHKNKKFLNESKVSRKKKISVIRRTIDFSSSTSSSDDHCESRHIREKSSSKHSSTELLSPEKSKAKTQSNDNFINTISDGKNEPFESQTGARVKNKITEELNLPSSEDKSDASAGLTSGLHVEAEHKMPNAKCDKFGMIEDVTENSNEQCVTKLDLYSKADGKLCENKTNAEGSVLQKKKTDSVVPLIDETIALDESNLIVDESNLPSSVHKDIVSSEFDELQNNTSSAKDIESSVIKDIAENSNKGRFIEKIDTGKPTSDDDIIQPSQDPGLSRFNLSVGRKRSSSVKSSITPKSNDSTSQDSCSPGWDLSEKTSKKRITKLKTKLVPVIEMPCDSGVYPLNIDGVTAEDDLFLIQCPTEVDPKLLIDKEIVLSGKCRINLGDSLNPALYDYFTIEEQSQRPVDVLLPNQCHNSIQIGRFPLSGSTILSTSTEVPESGTAKFPPLKRGLLSPNTSSNKNKSSASIDQEKYRTSELTSQEERHMNLRISSTEPILISQINDSTFKPAQQNLNVEDSDSSEWQSIYEQESKHENKKRRFALSPSACVNLHKFKTPPVLPSKAVEPFTHLQDLGKYSLSERSLPSIDQPLEYYSVFEKIDSTSKSQEIIGDEGREEVDQLPASQNSESGFSHFLSPSKSKKRRKKKDSLDKNSEIELTSSLHQSPEKESESVSSFSNHRKVSADDDESRDVDQLTTSQTSESVFSQFLSPSKSKRRRKKEDSLGKNSETEFTSLFLQSPKKESESDTASSSLTHRRGSIVDGQKHMFPVAHSQRIKLFNEIVNVKLDSQPLREDNIFSPDGQLFEDLPVPGKNYSPGNSERLEDNEALSSKSQHPEILLLSEGSGSTLKNVERPGGVEYIIPDNEVPNPSSPSKNSNSSSNKGEEFILPGKPFTKPQLANNTFSSSFSLELGDISEESEYILPAYIAPIQTKSSDVPEFHVIPRKDNEDKSEPEGQAKSDEFILPENNCHLTSESTTSKRKKKKKKKSRDEYLVEDNVVAQPTEISVTEEQAVSENSSTSALDSSDKKNIKKKRKKNKNDPMDYEVHSVLPVNFETSQPANVQSKVITEFSIKKKRKKKKRSLAEDPVDDILQRILPADLEEPYVESVRSKVPNESVSKKKRKKNILIEVSEEGSTPSVLPFELETLYHESSQPAGLNESVSRKKKKKRKRSLEESFENEIMLTNEECPIIVPSSDDIKPPKKKKKKKKNNSEEESFENEIMLTNEECPIIVPSSDDIKPPKKKKKKKKNNSEDLLKNVLENSADVSTFGEESSMGNDKYKTEVEFVVHELKPDIRNPDISSLYKKEKKKKNKLEDDANSVLIQNLLQNEYKKFDKKQKKRKSSKDSLIDPLAEVGTAEQSAPELSYESGIFDKKDHRKKKKLDDYFLKPTNIDYFLQPSKMEKDFNVNS